MSLWIGQFQASNCLVHSQVKTHGMVYFWICVFFKFFFSNTIFKRRFWILTNLHPICLQLNFNPIVQLKWIEIKFSWSGLQLNCNVVHTSISYRNELMSLASRTFEKKSCFAKIFFLIFLMLLVLVQTRKIYCMFHIA